MVSMLLKMMPVTAADKMVSVNFSGNDLQVGAGLHDSSAALIPYLVNFKEPFVLISTRVMALSSKFSFFNLLTAKDTFALFCEP